jgi:hypothetical protein
VAGDEFERFKQSLRQPDSSNPCNLEYLCKFGTHPFPGSLLCPYPWK